VGEVVRLPGGNMTLQDAAEAFLDLDHQNLARPTRWVYRASLANLATFRAVVTWWRQRGWLAADPTGELKRRRDQVDRTRALTRGQLQKGQSKAFVLVA
jgi:hypothetical protein